MEIVPFILLVFGLFVGLSYALLILLTIIFWNEKNRRQFKRIILFSSLIISTGLLYFFLFTTPVTNYKTAYISQAGQNFNVTVQGKRLYMFHDSVSSFLRKAYVDSATYRIPRRQGITKGKELPYDSASYKATGTISITNNKMKIDIYYNNYDDKTLDADVWNGNYDLVWR